MGMSGYLKDVLLGHTLLGSSVTLPTTVYLSLATSCNSIGTVFQEVSQPSYSRQRYSGGAPSSFVVTNAATISFGTALTTWGLVKHVGIWDAPTGGNLLYLYNLTGVGRKIVPNMPVYVNSSAFRISY